MRKWITVEPCELPNWTIRQVTLEKMKFREMVEGVIPQPRYPRTFANSEDKVHAEPDKVNTENRGAGSFSATPPARWSAIGAMARGSTSSRSRSPARRSSTGRRAS